MTPITFITGNQHKADYLARYLGYPVEHLKLELDEIQSLDLKDIVRHKLMQAYEKVGKPVLVEDMSLEFAALGKLPGTFIKWFVEELKTEGLCQLLDGKERSATARCMFGYFDGKEEHYFDSQEQGTIPEHAAGTGGFGWDAAFVPHGYTVTSAELSEEEYKKVYLSYKPFAQFKEFLQNKK